MIFKRSLEMSISREDFLRLLPAAVSSFEVDGQMVRALESHPRWTICLIQLADRRLANVVVPRHRVEISLDPCSEAEGEAFMERFKKAFLRGGG